MQPLTIGRLAAAAGVNIETVRYYERIGAQVREIARTHLEDVRAKLADLYRLETILAATIAQCSGDAAASGPVLDMLTTRLRA